MDTRGRNQLMQPNFYCRSDYPAHLRHTRHHTIWLVKSASCWTNWRFPPLPRTARFLGQNLRRRRTCHPTEQFRGRPWNTSSPQLITWRLCDVPHFRKACGHHFPERARNHGRTGLLPINSSAMVTLRAVEFKRIRKAWSNSYLAFLMQTFVTLNGD